MSSLWGQRGYMASEGEFIDSPMGGRADMSRQGSKDPQNYQEFEDTLNEADLNIFKLCLVKNEL